MAAEEPGASERRTFWSVAVVPSSQTPAELDGGWTVVERKVRGKTVEKKAAGAVALHEMNGQLASAARVPLTHQSTQNNSAKSVIVSSSSPDRLQLASPSYSSVVSRSASPIFTSSNKNQTAPPEELTAVVKGRVSFAASVYSPQNRTRLRSRTRLPRSLSNGNSHPAKRSSAHFSTPIDRADSNPINTIPLDFDRPAHERQAEYDDWNRNFMQRHPEHQLETRCYPHYCPNKYRVLKCACVSCEPHHVDNVIVHSPVGNVRQFAGSPSLDKRSRRRRYSGHLGRDFSPPVVQRLSDTDFYSAANLSKISVEEFVSRNGMVLSREEIQALPNVHCLLARKGDAYSFADILKLPSVAQLVLFIKLLKGYTDASCAPVIRNSAPLVIGQNSCPIGLEVLCVPTRREGPEYGPHKVCRPWVPVRQRGYPNEEIYDGLMQRIGTPDADTQAFLAANKQSKPIK